MYTVQEIKKILFLQFYLVMLVVHFVNLYKGMLAPVYMH